MPTRKRRRPTTFAMILMAALSASGVGALGYYVATTANKVPEAEHRQIQTDGPEQTREPRVKVDVKTDEPEHQTQTAMVFTPRYQGEDLSFTSEPAPVPEGEDPKVFALNAYLEKAGLTKPGAKALSVDVKDGVATVSFTESIMGDGYGSDDERTLVNGIGKALGQFKDIKQIFLTIGGKPIESFGHLDLTEPIKPQR